MGRVGGFIFFGLFAAAGVAAFVGSSYELVEYWLANGRWKEPPLGIIFGAIFLLTHGGVGFGGLLAMLKIPEGEDDIEGADPSKPWLTKRYWASPSIESNMKVAKPLLLGIGKYFAVVSVIVVFAVIECLRMGETKALYGLIIPGITVLIFWWSAKINRRYKRYGEMYLVLDPYPASIGGEFGGAIKVAGVHQPVVVSEVKIDCVREYKSGEDSSKKSVWQEVMIPAWEQAAGGSVLRFCFDLPGDENLPESDPSDQNMPRHEWTLRVSATLADGNKLERRYADIPVFRTSKQSTIRNRQAHASHSSSTQARHANALDILMPFEVTGNGTHQVHYPAGRNLWGLGIALIGIGFVVGGIMIPSTIFNIVFPLVGGIAALSGVYMAANSLTVSISPVAIETQRYLFGMKIKSMMLPSYEFEKFMHKESHSTQAKEITQYYNIEAHGKAGQRLVVAENLKGMGQVKAAITRLEELQAGPGS